MIAKIYQFIGYYNRDSFALFDSFIKIIQNSNHLYQSQAIYLLNHLILGAFSPPLFSEYNNNFINNNNINNNIRKVKMEEKNRYQKMRYILEEYVHLLEELSGNDNMNNNYNNPINNI